MYVTQIATTLIIIGYISLQAIAMQRDLAKKFAL